MQNGCICCTLQSDLVDQIVNLTQKKKFNYVLIEASGVSEPHEIAPLFDLDEHEHDEDEAAADCDVHKKPQLGEVAKLDTCVTVIDSAEFYNNLNSMKTYDQCDVVGTIAELMMDQVSFEQFGRMRFLFRCVRYMILFCSFGKTNSLPSNEMC